MIFTVQSKATPLIVRAVVSFGADTIVIAGVVVGVATVASAVVDETLVTDPHQDQASLSLILPRSLSNLIAISSELLW